MLTAWILTEEYNEYDQQGEYFVTWFSSKPSEEKLRRFLKVVGEEYKIADIEHILKGGGRIKHEYRWYNLKEVKEST